jgi:hypothetical protein
VLRLSIIVGEAIRAVRRPQGRRAAVRAAPTPLPPPGRHPHPSSPEPLVNSEAASTSGQERR